MTSPSPRALGRPWLLVTGGWLAVGLISAAQTSLFRRLESGEPLDLGTAVLVTVPGWWSYALVTGWVVFLVRRVPFTPGGRGAAIGAHAASAMGVALLHALLVTAMNMAGFPEVLRERSFGSVLLLYLANRAVLELLIYGAILGGVVAWDTGRRLRARELATAALETQLTRAQLQALQGQLHPHFLFNTLNAIGVLVRDDPAAAARVVSLLADLLRRTLDGAQQQEVALREELDFLERYLEIERTRFPDRLRTAIEVAAPLRELLVPSFLLQPLVENAVRYGIAPRPEGGRVVVRAAREGDRLVLDVWNDGAPIAEHYGEGIGLGATRERLVRLYGEAGSLELAAAEGGVRCRVILPAREG
ncbi:MAG TPA: histidine kinase [Gemmatimonadales bacterium]|nr:histidine kinase [Gemmatimonadales bacterium]